MGLMLEQIRRRLAADVPILLWVVLVVLSGVLAGRLIRYRPPLVVVPILSGEDGLAPVASPVLGGPIVLSGGIGSSDSGSPGAFALDLTRLAEPAWSVSFGGAFLGDAKCSRCDRRLKSNGSGQAFSGAVKAWNDAGRVFFDGCIWCLEEAVAAASSGAHR